MTVYLLFYSYDDGNREDWNVFYTPVEAYSSAQKRQERREQLEQTDSDLNFEYEDVEMDTPSAKSL